MPRTQYSTMKGGRVQTQPASAEGSLVVSQKTKLPVHVGARILRGGVYSKAELLMERRRYYYLPGTDKPEHNTGSLTFSRPVGQSTPCTPSLKPSPRHRSLSEGGNTASSKNPVGKPPWK